MKKIEQRWDDAFLTCQRCSSSLDQFKYRHFDAGYASR